MVRRPKAPCVLWLFTTPNRILQSSQVFLEQISLVKASQSLQQVMAQDGLCGGNTEDLEAPVQISTGYTPVAAENLTPGHTETLSCEQELRFRADIVISLGHHK